SDSYLCFLPSDSDCLRSAAGATFSHFGPFRASPGADGLPTEGAVPTTGVADCASRIGNDRTWQRGKPHRLPGNGDSGLCAGWTPPFGPGRLAASFNRGGVIKVVRMTTRIMAA